MLKEEFAWQENLPNDRFYSYNDLCVITPVHNKTWVFPPQSFITSCYCCVTHCRAQRWRSMKPTEGGLTANI